MASHLLDLEFQTQEKGKQAFVVAKPEKFEFYNNKSRSLISAKNSNNVSVDYLAFSFPLANLNELRKIAFKGSDKFLYPKRPKLDRFSCDNFEDFEKFKSKQLEKMAEFHFLTLKVFLEVTFDMVVSPPRGKGFQGYTDSLTVYTSTGRKAGFIGIGGQNETVCIQLSGCGCKHIESVTNWKKVHYWLSYVLGVSRLSRLDIAYDCFDNIYNCQFAEDSHYEGMFKTKGRPPCMGRADRWHWGVGRKKNYEVEMVTVGLRTSPVYWRIYNKKLEQGIETDDLTWYRNEVELKKWDIDALLNIEATFAGICPFAKELTDNKGVNTRSITKISIACLELTARVRHARRTAGKAFSDILKYSGGDLSHAFGLLIPDKHRHNNSGHSSTNHTEDILLTGTSLSLPPTYEKLIANVLQPERIPA